MSIQKVISALSFVPPHDRDTWVKMGMAIKSEFAEDGFDTWDAWSQGADSYNVNAAKSVWKSIGAVGKVGIGSLFHEAAAHGWQDDGARRGPLTPDEVNEKRRARIAREAAVSAEEARKQHGYTEAVTRAQALIASCSTKPHYYLNSKGLPTALALVADSTLVVPMRDADTNALRGAQTIDWLPTERRYEKKMIFGMRARGAVLRLGSQRAKETFLCEGYATGLSIEMALRRLRLNAAVLVCFSDSNMAHVASLIDGTAFVIADNDVSLAGEKAARKSGLPWVMSDRLSEDANDLHQRAGLLAVCSLLMAARKAPMG